uniref:G-protein coupled receptors family 1 profile domain-containing protein n=1 Tax=Magallana gigas TaxID=29159 RepID=A0A8W8MHW3_MAGGI
MDNDSYYHLLLENKTADIALGSTILIIIGGVIGVIGNSLIIYFYFFRVKERGERYFIPVLGVVDLLGCLTGLDPWNIHAYASCNITAKVPFGL